MKKLLLNSTAIAVSLVLVSPALAGGAHTHIDNAVTHSDSALNISIGGVIDFQSGFADSNDELDLEYDNNTNTLVNNRDFYLRNDTEIHVTVAGKTDNGTEYGAVIELEADVTLDVNEEGFNADKTYIFLQNKYGRLELGNNSAASQTMKVGATTIARATGGIDGDWDKYFNRSNFDFAGPFVITTPNLPMEAQTYSLFDVDSEDATKITYYTPRWNGFQFGASYTPDSENLRPIYLPTTTASTPIYQYEDVISVGLNYSKQLNDLSILASLTAEFGDNNPFIFGGGITTREGLEAYHAGLVLGYKGFSIAAGYGDWTDSASYQSTGGIGPISIVGDFYKDGSFWEVGASYETGKWGASVTYFDSEINFIEGNLVPRIKNEFNNLSIGIDYQFASGLVPYIEYSMFEIGANGEKFGDGDVLIIGAELSF